MHLFRHTAMLLLAGLFVAGASTSCSFVVESEKVQCQVDADCVHFAAHPFCVEGVCVESGLGPVGCFYGTPQTDLEYLNQCSKGTCIKFDNVARLGLQPGQKLPALP